MGLQTAISRIVAPALGVSVVMFGLSSAAFAIPGLFPTILSGNTTGYSDSIFTGAPDDSFLGIGGQTVTYDFGFDRIVDGTGNDFNVYEVDYGVFEFGSITVSVSLDGTTFFDVTGTQAAWVNIDGDEAHGNNFKQSYDLDPSGLGSVRYVRIDGNGTGAAGGTSGFDLDAIGAVNFKVPESGTLAIFGLGLAGLGLMRRRRRVAA